MNMLVVALLIRWLTLQVDWDSYNWSIDDCRLEPDGITPTYIYRQLTSRNVSWPT